MDEETGERFAFGATGLLLIVLAAILIQMLAGCRVVRVKTPEWSASYVQFLQSTEAEKLEVQAGENVALKIGKVQGQIDPKAKEAAAALVEYLRGAGAAAL